MDTLFFLTSKAFWAVARPETLLILLLGYGLFALWRGRLGRARAALTAGVLGLVALAAIPLGGLVLRPLEARFPPNPALEQVDGIVVLGGSELPGLAAAWGQAEVNDAGERFLAAIALANRYPGARLLFSGGSGAVRGAPVQEASVAERIFLGAGIAPERLILEDRSRNTAENAAYALARLGGAPDGRWVLVTSAAHMPRAVGTFCAAGWTGLIPYPVDHRSGALGARIGWDLAPNLVDLNRGVREWLGLAAYFATGRTRALFPRGCG